MGKQILPEIKKPEALEIAIHCLGVQAEQEVCEECLVYGESGIICKEVAIVAISALKEIQQYRAIGTVEECREAVEKQKPKVGIVTAGKSYPIMCPSCGHKMDLAYHYCVFCGQSLIYLQKHEQAGDQMGE